MFEHALQVFVFIIIMTCVAIVGCGPSDPDSDRGVEQTVPPSGESGVVPPPRVRPVELVKPHEAQARAGSGQTFQGTVRAVIPNNVRAGHVSWSPDGKYIVAEGCDGDKFYLQLWDVKTGKVVGKLPVARLAKFSPNGQQVIAVSFDDALFVIDIGTAQVTKSIPAKRGDDGIFLSQDGRRAFLLDQFSAGEVIDLKNGNVRTRERQSDGMDFRCGDISPDGKLLAVSASNGHIVLVDAETLKEKEKTQGAGRGRSQRDCLFARREVDCHLRRKPQLRHDAGPRVGR